MDWIRFECVVCGKEIEIALTKPLRESIARGVPVAPPSEWGSQLVWKQDVENGRVASVNLPLCSGVCLTSLQQNPDQFAVQNMWQHTGAKA